MLAAAGKVCQEAGEVSALGFVAATWVVSSSLAYYRRFDERNCYMRCIRCGSMQRRRDGHTRLGGQRILLVLRPSLCSPLPVLSQRHSTALPFPKRYEERYEEGMSGELRRISLPRTSVNKCQRCIGPCYV